MALQRGACAALIVWCFGASALWAQDDGPAARYPDDGIAILNCAPGAPVPDDSCTLRVPPGYDVSDLRSDPVGDVEVEFNFARQSSARFPSDLTLSATVLLIDLSPGPARGRAPTFETEKILISELLDGLPTSEDIAIYGFNEELVRVQDFTTDRAALQSAIDGLALGGSNTLIGPFVRDAATILSEREDVVYRNIVLVSDGDDESGQSPEEIAATAVGNDVIVSTLGTYWRDIGARESGAGITFMRSLAQGTLGITGQAPLQNPQAAGTATGTFVATLSEAMNASGLIVPVGPPAAAQISVTVGEPVLGQTDLRPREVLVNYRPASAATDDDAEPADDETTTDEATLFGYPALYVYAGGGGLVVLLALLVALAMRRGDENNAEMVDVVRADDAIDTQIDDLSKAPTKVYADPSPAVAPSAYLIFENRHQRGAIVGQRVNIGRSQSNEIVIEAESISRLHAQIYKNRDGGFSIADMDSLNGTFVNGERINGTEPVGLGDVITFGKERAKLTPA